MFFVIYYILLFTLYLHCYFILFYWLVFLLLLLLLLLFPLLFFSSLLELSPPEPAFPIDDTEPPSIFVAPLLATSAIDDNEFKIPKTVNVVF